MVLVWAGGRKARKEGVRKEKSMFFEDVENRGRKLLGSCGAEPGVEEGVLESCVRPRRRFVGVRGWRRAEVGGNAGGTGGGRDGDYCAM